ncbi:nuclear hormone receptor HR96 isoform X1 [Photinus pyralis]|uniref:Nuclear hormone receptor HR96 n=1 Tax=Photinus pyralis TaxID=7054 RepID=A0A1Y1MAX3_PHOPY|nr:nuclear hormone receptor HR96 isoform X1 [Photinus pyralis]
MDTKFCGVCGDKALGYNFNAVTCESCKAFFRRNALTKKEFKCPFSEQCEITTVTRRFCQKCRLEKCFSIGMRKDYIMSEEDKVLKRQKIEENRAKKRKTDGFKSGFKKIKREFADCRVDLNGDFYDKHVNGVNSNEVSVISYSNSDYMNGSNSNSSSNSYTSDHLQSPEHITPPSMIRTILNPTPNENATEEDDEGPFLESLINNNVQNCNHNTTVPVLNHNADAAKDIIQDVQRIPIEANSIESILCEAIKLEFEAYTSISQCQSNSRELNDAERAKLNELIVANKALLTPLDDDFNNSIDDSQLQSNPEQALHADPALVDVINLTAVAIRRLIKMAKKINAFKNMCQEDQVALLKGGCTEMMILRSAMDYDPTRRTWRIPHSQESLSNLKVDVLKLAKGNIYQEHERFIKTFDPQWRSDENVILILCAITLFTPDRPRVIHQDVIKLEQNSYYYLLRRYLESVYPGCTAKSTFLKLIQKISELHKLNDEVINVYLNVNPSEVEPLLIEIFDLKNQAS